MTRMSRINRSRRFPVHRAFTRTRSVALHPLFPSWNALPERLAGFIDRGVVAKFPLGARSTVTFFSPERSIFGVI